MKRGTICETDRRKFILEMVRLIDHQFSKQELDFFWSSCLNKKGSELKPQQTPRSITQQDFQSQTKRFRTIANEPTDQLPFANISNFAPCSKDDWIKDKKYELGQHNTNTPANFDRDFFPKFSSKLMRRLDTKMKQHYEMFKGKIVKIGELDGRKFNSNNVFPYYLAKEKKRTFSRRRIDTQKRKLSCDRRNSSCNDCVPGQLLQTLRSSSTSKPFPKFQRLALTSRRF